MKPTVKFLPLILTVVLAIAAPTGLAAEKKDEHGHSQGALPESKIVVPADAAGIWTAIAGQQKMLAEYLGASQFDKTDEPVGALAKLISALPAKAAADKQKLAAAQAKAAVNVVTDIHHLADDKKKGQAEAKLTLLESALGTLRSSVPEA
jgi:hypothetical protein